MKRILNLIIMSVVLFALTNCKKDNSNQTQNTEELGFGCDPIPQDSMLLIPELDTATFFAERQMNFDPSFSLDMPPIENQGDEFSCIAFACAYAARSYQYHRDNQTTYTDDNNRFSPEFLYNSIKSAPGNCQIGTNYKTALEFLKNYGVCTWAKMPYSSTDGCSVLPNQTQKDNASLYKIVEYFRVPITTDNFLKRVLEKNNPILIAVNLDAGFANKKNNVTWKKRDGQDIGGHAMVICGWDDNKDGGAWKVMNSWGTDWHDNGYGWIAYDYLDDVVRGIISYKEMFVMKTKPLLPVTNFSASQTNITTGSSVNYTDLSTSSPTSWSWSFQGGTPSTSTLQNPTNIQYNTAGVYSVTLVATNASGNDTETKTAYITVIDNAANCGTVTDIDGNVYNTVTIGTQCWTLENLKTVHYNDGTAIATGLSDVEWASTTTGAYAIYENNASNNITYGKLYNWYAVNTGKLAPAGWHVPSDAEWQTLIDYLGGSSVAGGKMKATILWNNPTVGANNSSGFTALPAGFRRYDGPYRNMSYFSYFWSSTQYNQEEAFTRGLIYEDESVSNFYDYYQDGFPIRCVKD